MRCAYPFVYVCVILASTCIGSAWADEPAETGKIRVLVTWGGHGYPLKALLAILDEAPNIDYKLIEMPKEADLLKPGLEKNYDVLVMYDMVNQKTGLLTAEQREAFIALLNKGIGVVSLHHNLGAHADWDEFCKIIGGKYILYPCKINGQPMSPSSYFHLQQIKVTVIDKNHQITRGIADFEIQDETYHNCYTSPRANVLLTTNHPKSDTELAWTTRYGNSRVFYFKLGDIEQACSHPSYRKILLQGISWAAGR